MGEVVHVAEEVRDEHRHRDVGAEHSLGATALDELRGIALTPAGLRIGALTRHVELLHSPLVRDHAPLLAQANYPNRAIKLVVPFAAIKSFFDPSVKFGLQFEAADEIDDTGESEDTSELVTAAPVALPPSAVPLACCQTKLNCFVLLVAVLPPVFESAFW